MNTEMLDIPNVEIEAYIQSIELAIDWNIPITELELKTYNECLERKKQNEQKINNID